MGQAKISGHSVPKIKSKIDKIDTGEQATCLSARPFCSFDQCFSVRPVVRYDNQPATGRRQKKVVLLGGAHHKEAYPPVISYQRI